MGALQAAVSILQTATNIVLARMLFPEDFGIIALAQAFIYFVYKFQDFGLGTAIIQKQGRVEHLLYTANLIRTVVSLALVAICFFLSPLWADFYDEQALTGVIRLLAVTFLLNSAVFIPRTLLKKEMDFRRIFFAETLGALLASITKIVLVVYGIGFWAIPIGALAGQATSTALFHLLRPYPFRFLWGKAAALELFRFCRFLLLAGIIQFLNTNLGNMTVGKALGLAALGYFDIAYRWGTWLTAQLSRIVASVFLPTLSRIQSDLPRLGRAFLRSEEILVALCAPLFLGMAAVSPEFIVTLLGAKWTPSSVTLSIATFCGLFRTLQEIPQTLLVSVGRVRWSAISAAVVLAVTAVAIVPLTLLLHIEGAAIAVTLAAFAGMAVVLRATTAELGIPFGAWLRVVAPPLVSAGCMGAAVFGLRRALPMKSAPLRLLILAGAGAAIYTAILWAISRRSPRAWFRHAWPHGRAKAPVAASDLRGNGDDVR